MNFVPGPNTYYDSETNNRAWQGKELEHAVAYLESLVLLLADDEKLPMLLEYEWISSINRQEFERRIKQQ